MKLLLSLSIIPLLLLTNVSAADEDLPLSPYLHNYENPTTEDGFPFLAIIEGEWNNSGVRTVDIIKSRAHNLCILFGHKGARKVSKKDVQFDFEGKAYLDGNIVDIKAKYWSLFTRNFTTNAIFKFLRCVG